MNRGTRVDVKAAAARAEDAAWERRSRVGAALILAERQRQVDVEGYDPERDADQNRDGELIAAAWCYLGDLTVEDPDLTTAEHFETPNGWPWSAEAWKPTPDDDVRQLVKAGALIAAEIDRLMARRGQEPF